MTAAGVQKATHGQRHHPLGSSGLLLAVVVVSKEATVTIGPTRGRGVAAGLDRDHLSGDRSDRQRRSDPGHHVGSAVGSVQERTSMSCRVPSVSPLTRRDAIQKSSCAVVNTPAALACANAVDPGSAPGLKRQDPR